jgi:cobalt/nickel transport protein
MTHDSQSRRNKAFVLTGLGIAFLIAAILSSFASKNPDGLDRVSQDHKFDSKALKDTPAKKLPFYSVFEEYALRGVPEAVATPIAGIIGTAATFGLAWSIGKLVVRRSGNPPKDGSL